MAGRDVQHANPSTLTGGMAMPGHRVFAMKFASVYPIICWLTGYSQAALQRQITRGCDFETFFAEAPELNPHASLITGVVCGVRVEEVEDPLMRKIRYLDKLIDELAKGRPLKKILRH
jgi:hypothetical protein